MLGFAFVALALVMAIARRRCSRETRDHGTTTVVTALLGFALGAIAVAGEIAVAGVAAAALTLGPALPRVPRPAPAGDPSPPP